MNSTGAPLLPKLRGYIAEFLTNCSHERLWIFSSSTCVGLEYGSLTFSLEVFLGSVESATYAPYGADLRLSVECSNGFAYRSHLTRINRHSHRTACVSFCVTPSYNDCKGGPEC